MSLRARIGAVVEALVAEVAPQALGDLWGRHALSVWIPSLQFGPVVGRPETKGVLPVRAKVRAQLVTTTPDELPGEELWARLARPLALEAEEGKLRVHRCQLVGVSERIDPAWVAQDLEFDLEADLTGL